MFNYSHAVKIKYSRQPVKWKYVYDWLTTRSKIEEHALHGLQLILYNLVKIWPLKDLWFILKQLFWEKCECACMYVQVYVWIWVVFSTYTNIQTRTSHLCSHTCTHDVLNGNNILEVKCNTSHKNWRSNAQ